MPQVNHPTRGLINFPDNMGQEEIRQALIKIDAQSPTPAPVASAPEPAPEQRGRQMPELDRSAMSGLGISEFLSSPNATRYGVPLALAPVTGGASIPIAAAAYGGASVLGEYLARKQEGRDMSAGEAANVGLVGAVGSFVPGSKFVSKDAVRSGISKTLGYLRAGSQNAAVQGGATIAGDLAEDVVDGNAPKGIAERASRAIIPSVTGWGFGIFSRYGNEIQKTAADRRVAVEIFGKNELPPELIDPAFAKAGAAKAARSGTSKLDPIEEGLAAKYSEIAGNPIEGSSLSSQLAPYVGTLDDTKSAYGKAQAQADVANLRYKDAKDAYDSALKDESAKYDGRLAASLDDLNKASNAQMEANLGAISQEAFRLKQLKIDENYIDFPTLRNLYVTKIQEPLEEVVRRKADDLYKQINVNPTEPLVDGASIAKSIGASSKAGTASEDELAFITNKVLARISSGKDEAGDVIYKTLSLNDARDLRRELWDLRDNVPSGTTRADSLLGDVDKAISSALEGSIFAKAGDTGLAAYRDANVYWRAVSQARFNPLARALMSKSPTDESVQTMISKLVAKGPKADEKVGVDAYIASVAGGQPAIEEEMKGQLMAIVRGGVVAKNMEKGLVNVGKLADDMAQLKRNGFPVNSLNLGGVDEMRQIAALSNRSGLGSHLTQEQVLEILATPGVQDAIMAGNTFGVASRFSKAAAKPIALLTGLDEAKFARAAEIAGLTKMASEKYAKAGANFRASGMKKEEIAARLQALEGDPLMKAFSGGKNFGLNGKEQENFDRFLSSIIDTGSTKAGDIAQLMSAIEKKSPELREHIAQRVIKDKLKWAVENPRTGKQNLDYRLSAESMFDKQQASRLEAVLGGERYKKLNSLMPQIEAMRAVERARFGSGAGEVVGQVATAGRSAVTQSMTGTGYFAKSVVGLVASGRYFVASFLLSNPKVWSVVERTGDLAGAIDSLGVQRAVLLYQNNPGLKEEVAEFSGR